MARHCALVSFLKKEEKPWYNFSNMEERKNLIITYLFYFLAGSCCLLIGSSLTQLVELYQMPISKVVLLGSFFAAGRVLSVNFTARLIEKAGPKVMLIGVSLAFLIFLLGIPVFQNYTLQTVFSFLGGVGLGIQDTCGPVLFAGISKANYATHMSMGQALFGIGNFATPFLISIMLKMHLPFYDAFWILAILPIGIILLALKMRVKNAEEVEEQIAPLHVKNMILAAGLIAVIMIAYSSIFNCLCTYTTSYGELRGMSAADASILLTVFNVGGVVGSFLFAALLKKISEMKVLIGNLMISGILLFAALQTGNTVLLYILFGLLGIFIAVLFGIIFTVATRVGYRRMTLAAGLTSTASGLSDIATPLVTGWIIEQSDLHAVYSYILILMGICCIASCFLKYNIKEKE